MTECICCRNSQCKGPLGCLSCANREIERLRKALESGVTEAEKVLSVHKDAAADNGRKGDQRKSDMAFGACCAAQSILDELRALSKDALR